MTPQTIDPGYRYFHSALLDMCALRNSELLTDDIKADAGRWFCANKHAHPASTAALVLYLRLSVDPGDMTDAECIVINRLRVTTEYQFLKGILK